MPANGRRRDRHEVRIRAGTNDIAPQHPITRDAASLFRHAIALVATAIEHQPQIDEHLVGCPGIEPRGLKLGDESLLHRWVEANDDDAVLWRHDATLRLR